MLFINKTEKTALGFILAAIKNRSIQFPIMRCCRTSLISCILGTLHSNKYESWSYGSSNHSYLSSL